MLEGKSAIEKDAAGMMAWVTDRLAPICSGMQLIPRSVSTIRMTASTSCASGKTAREKVDGVAAGEAAGKAAGEAAEEAAEEALVSRCVAGKER